MNERPTRRQQLRRCLPVLLALAVVSATACVVVPASAPPAQSSYEAEASLQNANEEATLASSARRTRPPELGFEVGFTHCCGDFDYVMQVDCSERLLRCYANESDGWQQTYGRNCKSALGSGCYERGCISVCEGD